MKMTIKNEFHKTETTVESEKTGDYESGEKYAEFTEKQLNKIGRDLCGGKQCTCGKFGAYCTDEDGINYRIDLVS
jgi:hypothetical protein